MHTVEASMVLNHNIHHIEASKIPFNINLDIFGNSHVGPTWWTISLSTTQNTSSTAKIVSMYSRRQGYLRFLFQVK